MWKTFPLNSLDKGVCQVGNVIIFGEKTQRDCAKKPKIPPTDGGTPKIQKSI